MFGKAYRRVAAWIRQHPSDSLLLSYFHGELHGECHSRTLAHLNQCPDCARRAEQIELGWKAIAALGTKSSLFSKSAEEELIQKIRGAIHTREAQDAGLAVKTNQVGAETERRIEEVLGAYLGKRAAASLLRNEEKSGSLSIRGRLDHTRLILHALLGSKGAEAVELQFLRLTNQPLLASGSRSYDSDMGKRA